MEGELDKQLVNKNNDKLMKLMLIRYRLTPYEYVSYVLFQDVLVSVVNILIVCIELDAYKDNVNVVYTVLVLPCVHLLVTFVVMITRYETLKTNRYQHRMMLYNNVRLYVLLTIVCL